MERSASPPERGASDAAKREEKPLVEPGAMGARGARDTNPRRVPWALPGSTPGGFAPRFIASARRRSGRGRKRESYCIILSKVF